MSGQSSKQESFLSGELAELAGVSSDTLRHYERKGVLPAPERTHNGYRRYPPEAIERVRLVRRALAVGFTLDELASILKARARGKAPCREVRDLAEKKLTQVEARLLELKTLRKELRATLDDWNARLSKAAPGERVGLLEALGNQKEPRSNPSQSARSHFVTNRKRS
jgi:DNA-binding transcriptional MerR regulator